MHEVRGMAKERGWWKLETTVEPNTTDREHIAKLIEQGNNEGEICQDTDEDDDE